ncbi:MAG: HAD-IIIA family hydrolase [Candidatus Thermoplasmatota archaeon]|jgi:YrbI family 3-deoxy-D-manno-octulosonate 8-phosphate phosphatase|nr:HAD-IIIA family hydrolase [Candidatus Thermoplasmatota archaeon]
MTRIIQSFSIPDGSTAHHRLSEWKREGANISAIIQMLLESGQITDQETRLGDNWPRDWKRPTETVAEKMRNLKCILFDVDGVFTDGTILLDSGGNEQRRFSVIDGHGIALLRNSGLLVGVVSREPSPITRARMEKLRMAELHVGAKDKSVVLRDIKARHGLSDDEIAFMGDDVPDLLAFDEVGLRLAPHNAQPTVRDAAHWVSLKAGGNGAVREACEVILYCRN